ncbi:hypothetical protein [Sporanaerobacter acetigenes]|uniref:hypothetical protein n=2 Tax=Sporanaerobacter acetigenes TaxID=165813 RepID=UPI00104CEA9F|nr:hypothetical protein [Sporanaerobacter acetigenes]
MMKRNILILVLVIIVISFLILYRIYSSKDNNQVLKNEKYTKLFNNALTSDGAHSEGFFSELSDLFLKEPEYFIEQLSTLNDEDRKSISFHVAYIMCINEPELNNEFKDVLYGVKHREKDLKFNVILDNLIKEYEKIKNDIENQNND